MDTLKRAAKKTRLDRCQNETIFMNTTELGLRTITGILFHPGYYR